MTTSPKVERMLPLYQGMMVGLFDHRAADVVRSATALKRQNQPRYLTENDHRDPMRSAVPNYWVREELLPGGLPPWLIAFADVTSPTNERTLAPTALPQAGVNHKLPLILEHHDGMHRIGLVACLSSFMVDYLARQKVGGTSMTYFYVRQFPVLTPDVLARPAPWDRAERLVEWLRQRALPLIYTSVDMKAIDPENPPFVWNPERRVLLRAELDAAFFHLYGVTRDDVDYIMETFPIVKRKDIAEHGEFRTKRLILEVYDKMQAAIDSGTAYQTILDPPPGEGPRHPEQES